MLEDLFMFSISRMQNLLYVSLLTKDSARFHQADITKLLYIPDKKMLISSGKDCYMKFWHLLPDSKGTVKKNSQPKKIEHKEEDRQEWRGQESEESEEEEQRMESPEKKKESPKKQQKAKSPKKKKTPEKKPESSDEEDDDLTGWY
jgi:outer membrane biosynthesis protein TonB